MRHFNMLTDYDLNTFFKYSPVEFSRDSERETLGLALGAALYTPGSRPGFAARILAGDYTRGAFAGLATLIVCLEDAVADSELPWAEKNVAAQLKEIEKADYHGGNSDLALFLRVRDAEQLDRLICTAGSALSVLTGIVFPKCLPQNLMEFFPALDRASEAAGRFLYALPLLETKEVLYSETREQALQDIYDILRSELHRVLTVRVGATDFSSLYGLRRPVERTIYEVHVIRDCLTSVLNRFNRAEDGFVVSGPVYEHFSTANGGWMSSKPEKVLWEEVQLDVLNGFKGKTCIHPSQITIVNAGHIVSLENYEDAMLILSEGQKKNGVLQSPKRNKMNEVKPHLSWAKRIAAQAEVYGVLNENYQPIDVLNHIRAHQFSKQLL
ncbi:HpcH/HpaI aldolase/citrate lyase family protein [Planomicrobium sp. CPCC 101110]|uniref:HpcH/HpaI aldolase/citrate lyase family protein n=1 Tax=Planomicrobium sp. CPCC 101110 TaxID=2599619 RepID=UPI0011B7DE3C|nr:HpcH/HpaI aldolase/citrate lyase family protein [Planomicrobium sp. CPCC 101110]TWT27452.1 HpcH/HpaI aldolase/citrate lyase family protein [Planomicrobium sp. CPCC 101110]